MDPKKVCFVCLGNIVRSPLAENMFYHLVKRAGLEDKYQAESAGTSSWHEGEKPDHRMRRVAASHGFEYSGRARQFHDEDFDNFDIIIAMDSTNFSNLLGMARTPENQAKIHMMREFDPEGTPDSPVPDPYYGGIDGFEDVFQIVKRSCQGFLKALEDGSIK